MPFRVACERGAYAEVIAHAKESLQSEICGALAGEVCEDEEGLFIEVKAAIRGAAAREGSTHVTFTQETWNAIHRKLEQNFPKLQIVGWYHSHPGFGVEFSEMDVFIQKNFFPAATQIALVTDPLGGDVAICQSTAAGIRYLDRFWVDGREHQCRVPARQTMTAADASPATGGPAGKLQEDVRALEARLGQVLQGLDEQHSRFQWTLMALFVVVAASLVGYIGWSIWHAYAARMDPPHLNQYVRIPVQIGERTVMLGVQVVDWEVPPELNALMIQMAAAVEKAAKEELQKQAKNTNTAPAATNPPAAAKPKL